MSDVPARILLVEDEEAHAELARRAFERAGNFELKVASTVGEAERVLRDGVTKPDLVIADLRLPDGLGTDLIGKNGAPVVVITSHGDEAVAVDAMKAGAFDYVVKSEAILADMPHLAERSLREWRLQLEQKRLEGELAERERLASIGMAAAILAHEIGNPLNNMFLTAQILERRAKQSADEALGQGLGNIMREIRRLNALLADFRALARRDALELRPTDVGALLARLLESAVPPDHPAGIGTERRLPEDLVVHGHADKIEQAFLNLIKNAVETMPDGGMLIVRAARQDDHVIVEISDTGPGIDPDVDVFQPFMTTKPQGTGLGLPIVRQLIAAHAGTVTYSSVKGEGTTFRVVLPVAGPVRGEAPRSER